MSIGSCAGRLACAVFVLQFAARADGNWLKNFAKPKPQLRIMEGVTEHLHNVMPYEQVQFSDPNVSTAYVSSTKFQAAGMGHLYFVTNKFIEYILSDQAFPEGKRLVRRRALFFWPGGGARRARGTLPSTRSVHAMYVHAPTAIRSRSPSTNYRTINVVLVETPVR